MKTGILVMAIAALSLVASQTSAKEVTAADRRAVAARMTVLEDFMKQGDFASAMDVVPPRIIRSMAERFGATEAQIRQAVREATAGMMQDVSLVSYAMDLDAAQVLVTPNGARDYLMIPTSTVMDVKGAGRVMSRSRTLAMSDDGEWYLVRVSEAQQAELLRQVYPDFAGVDFPSSTMERAD